MFIPAAPLSAGPHDLSLSAAVGRDGEAVAGAQVVVVMVEEPAPRGAPAATLAAPLVVLAPRSGEGASRALQVPGAPPAEAPTRAASVRAPAPPAAPAAAAAPPSVDAIDYGDKGEVRFSGRSEPGST
ncbi:MAG: hypothetical protein AB7O45_14815, partial [Alphaproteobacteria bacterium]